MSSDFSSNGSQNAGEISTWLFERQYVKSMSGLPVVLCKSLQKRMWPTQKWRQRLWSTSHWTPPLPQFPLSRTRKRRKAVHISREKRNRSAADHAWTRHPHAGVKCVLNSTSVWTINSVKFRPWPSSMWLEALIIPADWSIRLDTKAIDTKVFLVVSLQATALKKGDTSHV